MNKSKVLYCIIAILFSVFMFIYGGYDDSPGAQGLGIVIFIISIASLIKSKKKTLNN